MSSAVRRWAPFVFLSLLCSAQPQGTSGAISGVVLDASGAAVPEASVLVVNASLGIRRNTATETSGLFRIPGLPPGSGYTVSVTKGGFAQYQASRVEILVGQEVSLPVNLDLVQVRTRIEVEGSPIVEATKTGVSQVVESSQTLHLPINGRRVDSYVLLTPAVVPDGSTGLISFRGIAAGNSFLTDGNDTTNLFYYENAGRTRVTAQISQDAVQEFQVSATGYSAEFGRASGGVVNTLTRSGSNDLHGTAYWFFRNRTLNARDSFSTYNPPEWRHQAGASLGGKLRQDRLFYFFNFEATRRKFPLVASLARPPLFNANGQFVGTCTAIAAQCASALHFLDRQFQTLDRTADSELAFGRMDWHPSSTHSVTASLNYLGWRSPNGERTEAVLNDGSGVGNNADSNVRTRYGRVAWTAIARPRLVFESRFGWFKDRLFDQLNPRYIPPETGLTQIAIAGQGNLGVGSEFPRLDPSENRYQFAETARRIVGRSSWSVGADWVQTEDFRRSLANGEGTYSYATFTDFALDFSGNALGRKRWQNYAQRFGIGSQDTTVNDLALFVQDQFRWNAKFTLNAGLRYEREGITQPSISNPAYPPTAQIPSLSKNLAPRIGGAYSVNTKTVLRAGYGIYYARIQGGLINTLFLDNGLYQTSVTLDGGVPRDLSVGPVFPNKLASFDPSRVLGTTDLSFAAPGYRNPFTHQGDIGIERELTRNWGLTATYLWSRGMRLTTVRDQNIGPLGPPVSYLFAGSDRIYSTPTYLLSNRVDPLWRRVNVVESGGRSFYRGLAVQLRGRFYHGLQTSVAYTWSRAEDYGQGGASENIFFNQGPRTLFNGDYERELARSALSQPHRLVVTSIWSPAFAVKQTLYRRLANGWQLSQISTFASAQPTSATVFVAGTPFGGAAFNTTLNGLGGSPRVPFLDPNSLDIGNVIRTDARLTRSIAIRERATLLLNFEAFNVFNHVAITSINTQAYELRNRVLTPTPGLGAGVAAAGYPDGTNARRAQVSLRLTF